MSRNCWDINVDKNLSLVSVLSPGTENFPKSNFNFWIESGDFSFRWSKSNTSGLRWTTDIVIVIHIHRIPPLPIAVSSKYDWCSYRVLFYIMITPTCPIREQRTRSIKEIKIEFNWIFYLLGLGVSEEWLVRVVW